MTKVMCNNPVEVAKEMFWLAWKACDSAKGMGIFKDNPTATREQVWESVSGQKCTDYCRPIGEIKQPYGDYVFGRMMKMGVVIGEDYLILRDEEPKVDYQSWAVKFSSYKELYDAALKNVG